MSIGLKRGVVYLEKHQVKWEVEAQSIIREIKNALGDTAVDVQPVGSTAVKSISAKPIIDIAVAVSNYDAVLWKRDLLERGQIVFSIDERPEQLLFVKGDFERDTRTHHIHVVLHDSKEWNGYIHLTDYLNAHPDTAQRYEALKMELSRQYPNDRMAYTSGKSRFISELLSEVL